MRKKLYILLYTVIFCVCTTYAQDDAAMRELYAQAEDAYRIGRIEQARDLLLQNLSTFQGNSRQNALHLIALTYMDEYDIPKTEQYVTLLLQQNPYYSPSSQDPATFVEIVNNIKAGMTPTITTASSQAESLAEVPVPTTLITAEMIQTSGARNLQEVLAAYVPGMHLIDCNDDINIAMRGIYSNTQEKILIMLNGHRLNSYATNTAAPDFSISLEKVKQIEVLRGPASSLYGGVALTGVVNIITKQGVDVDGLQAKVSAGNHGQVKVDAVFGKRYFDIDLLVWGSGYRNSGERYGDEFVRLGRIGNHPNYDFGLQVSWKGFQFMYDTHFSQKVAPYTMTSMAKSYDRERYLSYNGLKPSFSSTSHHADLSYSHQLGNLNLRYALTYDKSDYTRYQAFSDSLIPDLAFTLDLNDYQDSIFHKYGGISRYLSGQEKNYGIQVKGSYAYDMGNGHKGNISFGAEYGHFRSDDFRYQIDYDFGKTTVDNPNILQAGQGSENNADVYLQLKHQWRSLILNAGLRYDYKSRFDDSKANELSPRIALILLQPKWNLKLSYSKSFVDAPYIYRKANIILMMMLGGNPKNVESISPERVHSFQLTFGGNNWIKGLNFEINGFYNRANDLIMTHLLEYKNASKNETCGVELMASYKQPKFTADFNLTWTNTFKSNLMGLSMGDLVKEAYNTNIDANNNTPAFMSNLVLGWQVLPQLKLHTHILFESKQTSHNTDLNNVLLYDKEIYKAIQCDLAGDEKGSMIAREAALALAPYTIMHKEMSPRAIVNLGGEYTLGPVTFGLNIYNLFGTRYNRSGMNTNLIPQQGCWFLASVGVKI
jgi:iron complex outermembrane receptor protein